MWQEVGVSRGSAVWRAFPVAAGTATVRSEGWWCGAWELVWGVEEVMGMGGQVVIVGGGMSVGHGLGCA